MCMYACVHVHSVIFFTVQDGASPLYVASQEGHSEVVEILLRNGADPNLAWTVGGLVCSFHHLHVYCVLMPLPLTKLKTHTQHTIRMKLHDMR